MEANIIVIINSLALFALGFVPTLAALEVSRKMAYRLVVKKKENAAALSTAAGALKIAYDHDDITIRGENGINGYS